MAIKRVKLSDALKKKGKSRGKLLQNMGEEEIERRAKLDPDNPSLTEEQLNDFTLAKKRENDNEEG